VTRAPTAADVVSLQRRPARQLEKYSAPALDKGLDILELLAAHPDGLSQHEVARQLGRSVGEIFRMLATLERRGYIAQSDQGDRYVLTLRMFAISHQHPPTRLLIREALPRMQEVARALGQSCHLAVFHDGRVLIVAQTDAPGAHSYNVRMGAQVPVFQASSGMILLAFQTPAVRDHMLRECPDYDPAEREKLERKLARIRRKGFEEVPSYQVRGIYNLSCPILDFAGGAIAAMTVPFVLRIGATAEDRHAARRALSREAAAVSHAIGGAELTP